MKKIIDLSHGIENDMPVYPGTPHITVTQINTIEQDGFIENQLCFTTHTGTHVDVPAHILSHGKTLDSFNCEKFYGRAFVLNCTGCSEIDRDQLVKAFESTDYPDFLLFYTGWSEYWGTKRYFNDFPALTMEAAKYLSSLPVKGIGIDAISVDKMNAEGYPNHKILLMKDLILIENLKNLSALIGKTFMFSCFPLNILGAEAAPVRACAILD